MKTTKEGSEFRTRITPEDHNLLDRIVSLPGFLVCLEPPGSYAAMNADDLWLRLVIQVCVMGSARFIERILSDCDREREFRHAVSLSTIPCREPEPYLSKVLRKHKATRFYNKAARRLADMLHSPGVFADGRPVLLDGLSHKNDAIETRDELMLRCPLFGLKSASDFMIDVGLSHDVIALDTRVIGVFQEYLGYDRTPGWIQANRGAYLSLESVLRAYCRSRDISLALFDRLLFRFSGMSVIELAVEHPEVISGWRG